MAEEATSSKDGPSSGWADAMAKVLNKKIPQNKSTILAKNKTLEKERERKKQEREEKKMRVRKRCSIPCAVTVRWEIVSEHSPKSLLRQPQFWSLSFTVILNSLIFSFYFPVMLCRVLVFSLTASSGSSGRLNFGSRTVPVCQLKVLSLLRG